MLITTPFHIKKSFVITFTTIPHYYYLCYIYNLYLHRFTKFFQILSIAAFYYFLLDLFPSFWNYIYWFYTIYIFFRVISPIWYSKVSPSLSGKVYFDFRFEEESGRTGLSDDGCSGHYLFDLSRLMLHPSTSCSLPLKLIYIYWTNMSLASNWVKQWETLARDSLEGREEEWGINFLYLSLMHYL